MKKKLAVLALMAGFLAFSIFVPIPKKVEAVTTVTDIGGKMFKIHFIAAAANSVFGPGSFDFNGDGKRDMDRIIAIGYKIQAGAADTLWLHMEKGVFKNVLPASAIDSYAIQGRKIPDIAVASDTTVIRYHNKNAAATPLYIWGE